MGTGADIDPTAEPFNLYITGIDRWAGEQDLDRSDVNMIMTINPVTKKILLTSIPRDTYVKLHTAQQMDKLTHTGVYGVDETISTVEDWLNIDIAYYLKLNSKTKIKSVWQMWDEWTLNPIDFKCNYFEGRLDGEFSIAPQMTIGVGGKAELPKDMQDPCYLLFSISLLRAVRFTFMAGVVPVAIIVQPHLDLHVNAGVGGKIYTGLKYEYASEFSVGMKYQNGWQPISRYETKKNEFSFIKPTGSFSAEAEAGGS